VTFTASASWFIPRSRPRLASSSNAIILAAIGSVLPGLLLLLSESSRRPRRPAVRRAVPSCRREASSPRSCLGVVTLAWRVPTTCLALSPRECKPAWKPRATLPFVLRARHRARYNRSMSATEKLAISLPKDLIEKLRRAKNEGRIESVSGYITELLRREDDWRDSL